MNDADIARRSDDELVRLVARDARELLVRAGGLEALARADAFEIAALLTETARSRAGAIAGAQAIAAAFELGRRVAIEQARTPPRLESASDVAAWAMPRIGTLTHEELWMLGLDGRGHLRAARLLAKGGLHGASVRAADPLRAALRVDASAFVLVHNHPSGDPSPSREDLVFTEKVAAAADAAGVVLLDHVVVTRSAFASVPVGS